MLATACHRFCLSQTNLELGSLLQNSRNAAKSLSALTFYTGPTHQLSPRKLDVSVHANLQRIASFCTENTLAKG